MWRIIIHAGPTMATRVQCPDCHKKLKLGDELAGKKVKCPSCGRTLVVPAASPVVQQNESPLQKDELLERIGALVKEQEEAIRAHGDEVVSMYQAGRDTFLSQMQDGRDQWPESAYLKADEFLLVIRYGLCSSFIASWYHVAGDKTKRDTLAESYALILLGLRFDPLKVMHQHIELEGVWRKIFKASGIRGRQRAGCAGMVVVGLVVATAPALWVAFR